MDRGNNHYGDARSDSFSSSFPSTWSRFDQNLYRPYQMPSSTPLQPDVPSFSYHSPRRTLSLPSPIMEENNDLSDEENWKEITNNDINESDINESDINESDDEHVPEYCGKKKTRGSQNRFSPRQTRALVENRLTAITKLESSHSLKHWKLIQEHVNKLGSPKSVDQLKK